MKIRIKFFLILLFLFINLLLYTKEIVLPLELPQDQSCIGFLSLNESKSYLIKLEFSVINYKKHFSDNISCSFIIPTPSSNQFQKVSIIKTSGFEILDLYRERLGNSVIVTVKKSIRDYPDFLTVFLEVKSIALKYFLSKNYEFGMDSTLFITDNLFNNSSKIKLDRIHKLFVDKIDPSKSLNDFFKFIENYKKHINLSKNQMDRIYNKKINGFYPISKERYYNNAIQLIEILKKYNISARIGHGWFFPKNQINFYPDFIIEVFLPLKGPVILDKSLNLFTNNAAYINWYYSKAILNKKNLYGYIGALENDTIIFLKENIWITGGILDKRNKPDKRYNNRYDIKETFKFIPKKLEDFINLETSIKSNPKNFAIFKNHPKERLYYKKTKYRYIDTIITCDGVEKGKPVNVRNNFTEYDAVYVLIKFKDRKSEKKMKYTWMNPSDKKVYDVNVDVNKNWAHYYTVLNRKKNIKLEKGVWRLDIVINGVLDGRVEFIVK